MKGSLHIAKILSLVFKYQTPIILLFDNNQEFVNKKVKKITNKFEVKYYTTYFYTLISIIKQFNKTIKNKIFTYMKINTT